MEIEAEEQVFDSNLKEFASKVGLIVGLESNPASEIDASEAFVRIKQLYKELKRSKKGLNISGPQDA
jgi:hypothetical protein